MPDQGQVRRSAIMIGLGILNLAASQEPGGPEADKSYPIVRALMDDLGLERIDIPGDVDSSLAALSAISAILNARGMTLAARSVRLGVLLGVFDEKVATPDNLISIKSLAAEVGIQPEAIDRLIRRRRSIRQADQAEILAEEVERMLRETQADEALHHQESAGENQIVNEFHPGSIVGNFIQQQAILRGDHVSGDRYEIGGHAQIGAVGKGAKVKVLTFQNSRRETSEFDLDGLVGELHRLRTEMRKRASTTEHDLAVVAVGQAIAAAEEGNAPNLVQRLKGAGTWAIDLATAIGAGIAVEAIKTALGL